MFVMAKESYCSREYWHERDHESISAWLKVIPKAEKSFRTSVERGYWYINVVSHRVIDSSLLMERYLTMNSSMQVWSLGSFEFVLLCIFIKDLNVHVGLVILLLNMSERGGLFLSNSKTFGNKNVKNYLRFRFSFVIINVIDHSDKVGGEGKEPPKRMHFGNIKKLNRRFFNRIRMLTDQCSTLLGSLTIYSFGDGTDYLSFLGET